VPIEKGGGGEPVLDEKEVSALFTYSGGSSRKKTVLQKRQRMKGSSKEGEGDG